MARETKTREPVAPVRGNTPSVVPDPFAPEVAGSEAAATRFEKDAMAIDERDVMRLNADPKVAYHNALSGLVALQVMRAEIDATGHRVDWSALEELDQIGLAVIFVASQVVSPDNPGALEAAYAEARPLRMLLRSDARSQVVNKVFTARSVSDIEGQRGSMQLPEALIAYSALYRSHASKLRGKTAVTAAQVKRASELGTALLKLLRPKGSKRVTKGADALRAAADRRNRFWTLFVRRYELGERAGGSVWGRYVADHMPALQSRFVPKKRAKTVAKTGTGSAPIT